MEKKPLDPNHPFLRKYAIIYVRMSTEYQVQIDSNSSEMQRAACHKLCEEKGLHVKRVIEQVKSGRKYRQDLFDVIQNEMRAGDSIVVYSISRFARRQLHAHNLLEILRKKKCRLLSVTENMDTSKDDSTVGLFAWLAELESRQIASRVKSALEEKKRRGEHFGAMPFGYMYSEGRGSPLIENPPEMELVRRLKKMRSEEGMTFSQIARTLNREGVPTPKKKEVCGWLEVTVRKIVTRDESKIPLRGKRSWYSSKESGQTLDKEDSSEEEDGALTIDTPEEGEPEEAARVATRETPEPETDGPPTENSLGKRPLVVLRAMIMKRKAEFGLEDTDIKELGREDMLELLQ